MPSFWREKKKLKIIAFAETKAIGWERISVKLYRNRNLVSNEEKHLKLLWTVIALSVNFVFCLRLDLASLTNVA